MGAAPSGRCWPHRPRRAPVVQAAADGGGPCRGQRGAGDRRGAGSGEKGGHGERCVLPPLFDGGPAGIRHGAIRFHAALLYSEGRSVVPAGGKEGDAGGEANSPSALPSVVCALTGVKAPGNPHPAPFHRFEGEEIAEHSGRAGKGLFSSSCVQAALFSQRGLPRIRERIPHAASAGSAGGADRRRVRRDLDLRAGTGAPLPCRVSL